MNITIHTTRGKRPFALSGDPLVAEVAKKAVEVFDFPRYHHYGLLLTGNTSLPLRADRPLATYEIHDGSTLFLTITDCNATDCDHAGSVHADSK